MTDGSVKFDKFETASSLPSSENEAEYDPETNKAAVTNSKSVIRRKSTLYLERDGLTLEFDNIVLSTRSKNHEKNPPKQILKGVSSHFPAATLTAIMGASGSGKTSLLKCLIGRVGKNLDLGGEIRLDGDVVDPTDIDIRREFAYVEQEVSIPATCTPREAIRFSARLRLDKSKTDEDIDLIVNDILDSLGLNKCADTLIGGGPLMSGGLSGGEKKRVQCGVELVTNPRCIVLDEPTSGLDSYTAESLMDVLKNIAKAGATVIVVIHQPPPPVVRKIDNLLLLVQGEKLYDGPLGKPLEDRFNECGYPKPADYNIADWILQVTQVYTVEELKTAGFFVEKSKANQVDNTKAPKKKNQSTVVTQQVGFMIQTRYLFDREFKNLVRDKLAIIVRVGSTFTFGLLFGLIFLGVGRSDYVMYTEVQASFGAMANLLISTMFGVAQSSLMEFPKDRPVFLREYSTNHYAILPYFLSKFCVECITTFCQVLAQLIAFPMMGFKMNFVLFLLVNFTLALASTSIGIFVGSAVKDPNVAAELMPALIVPQLLFSGLFISANLIPSFLRWAQYLCSLTYAVRLVLNYEFEDCETEACGVLLESNSVNELPSYVYWIILILIMAICRLTAMLMLRSKASF